MNGTPLSSGIEWERIPDQATLRSRTNEVYLVRNVADHQERAYFKYPSADPRSSMYSIGIERVAFTIASIVDVPVKPTYLDEVDGHLGVITYELPGKTWYALGNDLIEGVRFADKARWPCYMALDVLLGNSDRHEDNIFVEWDPPHQRRPEDKEVVTTWFFDWGFSGLWTPAKFKDGLTAADLENLDPSLDLQARTITMYRNRLPTQFRQTWMTADREQVLDEIRRITEDQLEAAVREVPSAYISTTAADLTVQFLVGRLGRMDTLLSDVFPT